MERKVMERLVAWHEKGKDRKPLILDGARQVGKTYVLREFGLRYFKNTIYVNFETNLTVASYFEKDISPERIIRFLESTYNEAIIPGQTLIIFDEIQACERALTSLKYFCEDANEYHIAAAGSLLGVAINREKYSFPVGKVETITLKPLDIEEFLLAVGRDKLVVEIKEAFITNIPLPEGLHFAALELYRLYLIIGGMPAAVLKYLETGKLIEIADIQNGILNDYIADMAKYSSNTESVKIRAAYNSIPSQLAKENKKFQYKLAQKGGTAVIFGAAIEWLCFSGIVMKCQKIEQGLMPIAVYADLSSFKLYLGDVGILSMKSGIAHQTILSDMEINNTFIGAVAENYVAQALSTKGHPLYYWESQSIAEIDFVIQLDEKVIPIEVKSGVRTRSKSLSVYREKYNPEYCIRISAKNFGFENGIKSVPLYAVFLI